VRLLGRRCWKLRYKRGTGSVGGLGATRSVKRLHPITVQTAGLRSQSFLPKLLAVMIFLQFEFELEADMSLQKAKEQLVNLLSDADNKVLALSGRWGTGKTHMWRQVCVASEDDQVKNALYVSLFGIAEMAHVKLKIVQSAVGGDRASVSSAIKGARKVLVSIHGAFSALDEVALLAVPKILKGKMIVLDDIERKHESLSIDEVLGFIDEFTQLHGARFLLVLNSDKLKDQEIWNTLREKVIDEELRLDTSSQEAFGIALARNSSRFSQEVGDAVRICRLTNIRVIRKIIKVVNKLLDSYKQLPPSVISRVVPSTVLLAAIHYRGIENGPDIAYVLNAGRSGLHLPDDADRAVDEKVKRTHAEWDLLLSELGISSADDYEMVVAEYLESGLLDVSAVSAVIDRYLAHHDATEARNEVRAFVDKVIWDHRLSDEQLLLDASELLPHVRFLDAGYMTMLAANVADLPGGQSTSTRLVHEWLGALPGDYSPDPDDGLSFHRKLHPEIEAAFNARVLEQTHSTTLVDACKYISDHSGWGVRQESALQRASVEDFKSAIRNLDVAELRGFMRKMLELTVSKADYRSHFGEAMDRFVESCRQIVANEPTSRLSRLISALFNSYQISSLLDRAD